MNPKTWVSCLALCASAVACQLPSGACTLVGCESGMITLTMGDRVATSQVTLTPREVRPNGPSCEPVCNQPLVTVAPPPP